MKSSFPTVFFCGTILHGSAKTISCFFFCVGIFHDTGCPNPYGLIRSLGRTQLHSKTSQRKLPIRIQVGIFHQFFSWFSIFFLICSVDFPIFSYGFPMVFPVFSEGKTSRAARWSCCGLANLRWAGVRPCRTPALGTRRCWVVIFP